VTLNPDHEKYKTTVFEFPDKEAAASMIRDALGSR
jgi:hypothetical protein